MRKLLLLLAAFFSFSFASYAQHTVSGTVVDDKGVPAEGISVRIKGTQTGTSTDKNGFYSLKVSDPNTTLVFSGVGFNEQEIKLDGKKSVDIAMASSTVTLAGVEMVGTRSPKRSATETPVPIDIISISKVINQQGMVEINSILHYVAPSFNANRQSGSDGADHIDPATLRGMGPDQTLVLINGKRRHQISLVNLYGSRGRGNTGTDLNAIPASAIDRIEILRDGASAQYGSDAIAGVINIILKQDVNQLNINAGTGVHITGYGSSLNTQKGKVISTTADGVEYNANANYGIALKDNGFLNLTGEMVHTDKTLRPNYKPFNADDYRAKFGDGSYTNYSFMFNNRVALKGNAEFYSFGGVNRRNGDAYAWTRDPESERNVLSIYPDGFNPHIQSHITDLSLSTGVRAKFGVWNADFNATTGSNKFLYEVDKTLNASLEATSPTHFKAGGFKLAQSTLSANFSRSYSNILSGFNLALGTEYRFEQYQIFAGETTSWKQYGPVVFSIDGTDTTFRPGGAQGFPGFQPKDVIRATRNNIGWYVDGELDLTKDWLVEGAIRAENYSDFGFTKNFKFATKLKTSDFLTLRASLSNGFRAPSLPQVYFSSTFTNVQAGKIVDQVLAPNNSLLAEKVGIPKLKQEVSTNASAGFVLKPVKGLTLTVDGYWVNVKDRIVLTGLFDQSDDQIGSILESLNVGAAQFFTNAVNTKTSGLDVIATYNTSLGEGRLNATLAANFNNMTIDKVQTAPQLAGKEDVYFGPRERAFLLASAPPHKIGLNFDYTFKKTTVILRFTDFSKVTLMNWNDEPDVYKERFTTDLAFSFKLSKAS
ncbi:MAG: TonB-dependent receptor, partial [Bacteroidetes bacterium]|nr:TonB-dependent receptor [Bacteroidota bacterium]